MLGERVSRIEIEGDFLDMSAKPLLLAQEGPNVIQHFARFIYPVYTCFVSRKVVDACTRLLSTRSGDISQSFDRAGIKWECLKELIRLVVEHVLRQSAPQRVSSGVERYRRACVLRLEKRHHFTRSGSCMRVLIVIGKLKPPEIAFPIVGGISSSESNRYF
jgi:hypothetical protein